MADKWMGKLNIKEGWLTAQAKKRGMTVAQLAAAVEANPAKFDTHMKRAVALYRTFQKANHAKRKAVSGFYASRKVKK
jgi:hypothetical protein